MKPSPTTISIKQNKVIVHQPSIFKTRNSNIHPNNNQDHIQHHCNRIQHCRKHTSPHHPNRQAENLVALNRATDLLLIRTSFAKSPFKIKTGTSLKIK